MKYVIFNMSEVNKIDFNQVMETSIDTLRFSSDKTLSFIKYDGEMPSSILSLTTKSIEYNYNEFITILSTSTWDIPYII